MPLSKKTAILTFNGAEANAWLYDRPAKTLVALAGFPLSGERKPVFRDQRPRSQASVGARRAAIEPMNDPEKEMERQFVGEVAATIADHLSKGEFSRLIVAASPRALGYWREVAPRDVAAAVWKELPKDYVGFDKGTMVDAVEELLWA